MQELRQEQQSTKGDGGKEMIEGKGAANSAFSLVTAGLVESTVTRLKRACRQVQRNPQGKVPEANARQASK